MPVRPHLTTVHEPPDTRSTPGVTTIPGEPEYSVKVVNLSFQPMGQPVRRPPDAPAQQHVEEAPMGAGNGVADGGYEICCAADLPDSV